MGALRGAGELSQAEIGRRTGLSAATVSSIVRDLVAAGRVDVVDSGAGRRGRSLRLVTEPGLAVGLDFGHTHLRATVADLSREVLAEQSRPLDVDGSAEQGLSEAVAVVRRLLTACGGSLDDVVRVGLGMPGPIDAATGQVGSSAILPGWVGVRAAEELAARLGRPVLVDNDANLGALAEVSWGAARGARHAVYLKVASGLGAGLILDGRLYRGVGGTAGEIGHVTVDEAGPVCRCGNRGCLETYASVDRMLSLLANSHGSELTVERLLELAAAGDVGCRRVIADAGRIVGLAVAHLANLFNPEVVVIGGDLAQAGDLLLDPVRHAVSRSAIPSAAADVKVVPGLLGPRAEVLGALALALGPPHSGFGPVPRPTPRLTPVAAGAG